MNPNRRKWQICCLAMLLLGILSYTPLLIPQNTYTPMLGNIPYSLWAGILMTIAMVFVTYLGTLFHPAKGESEEL